MNMAVTVKLKYLRIAPRKVRIIADMIRQKTIGEAESQLEFVVKKAARPLKKLLDSATASAKNNLHIEKSNLYISKIVVDEGPTLKRHRPRARGRFFQILKRSSHITLTLEQISDKNQKGKAIAKERLDTKKQERGGGEVKKQTGKKKQYKKQTKTKRREPEKKIISPQKKMFRRKAF